MEAPAASEDPEAVHARPSYDGLLSLMCHESLADIVNFIIKRFSCREGRCVCRQGACKGCQILSHWAESSKPQSIVGMVLSIYTAPTKYNVQEAGASQLVTRL